MQVGVRARCAQRTQYNMVFLNISAPNNGAQFISVAVRELLEKLYVRTLYIEPGRTATTKVSTARLLNERMYGEKSYTLKGGKGVD